MEDSGNKDEGISDLFVFLSIVSVALLAFSKEGSPAKKVGTASSVLVIYLGIAELT